MKPSASRSRLEDGADVLKIFPANLFGPSIISSILGPLPQTQIMPTGSVEVDNAYTWIKAGAVVLGAGRSLTKGAKTGDYQQITETEKAFMNSIREARAAL